MLRAGSRALRTIALIVALAMLVIVAHTHDNGPAGRCDVCQAAHVAAHQAAAVAGIHPPAIHGSMIHLIAFRSHSSIFRHIFFTRGPPSFSL